MKTTVMVKRDFYQTKITQRSNDKFFCATDLLKYYNKNASNNGKPKKVLVEFLGNKNTIDFQEALANDINLNIGKSLYLKNDLIDTKRGKNGGTYMHPYLFVKFAMWLSPEFEVQVIKWVYDNLIDFRNQAGDNYKRMTSAIKEYLLLNGIKNNYLIYSKEASTINFLVYGSRDSRKRNELTEEQLELMNKLQLANTKLLEEGLNENDRFNKLRDYKEMLSFK